MDQRLCLSRLPRLSFLQVFINHQVAHHRHRLIVILMLLSARLHAEAFPQPLTLEQALSMVSQAHPSLTMAAQDIEKSRAQQLLIDAQSDLSIHLQSKAYYIEPSELASDQAPEDYVASLLLRKNVIDFRREKYLLTSQAKQSQAYEVLLQEGKLHVQIIVMRMFFDVLLADLRFVKENEAMAVAYTQFDRARKQKEIGKISDVDLLEKESRYQFTRIARMDASHAQRLKRVILTGALSQPNEPLEKLLHPEFDFSKVQMNIDDMRAELKRNNKKLRANTSRISALEDRILSVRKQQWPKVDAVLEAFEYNRELASRDKWRVGFELDIPLWQGSRVKAELERLTAELRRIRAEDQYERTLLGEQLLQKIQKYELLSIKRERAEQHLKYRETYLDRSRALYELEVQADLGDAMAQFSNAKLEIAESMFESIVVLAEIYAMLGTPLELKQFSK